MRYTQNGDGIGHSRFSIPARPTQASHKPAIRLPHTPLTEDAHTVYRATEDGCNVTVDCGYCGAPTRVWGVCTIIIGHLACITVEPIDADDDGVRMVPMTRKVNGCVRCAWDFDDLITHPQRNPRTGEYLTPYLDDTDSPTRKAEQASHKAVPSREVREFYGDTFPKAPPEEREPKVPNVTTAGSLPTSVTDWAATIKEAYKATHVTPTAPPILTSAQREIGTLQARLTRVERMHDEHSKRIASVIRVRIETLKGVTA